MTYITDGQRVVLRLTGAALFDARASPPEGVNWTDVYREALAQAVLPLAYTQAEPLLPSGEAGKWRRAAEQALAHTMRVAYEHVEVHDLMTARSIPYVAMKGAVSAAWYPRPELRMMGDVDFLVRPEDLERAEAALKDAGFQREPGDSAFHHAWQRGDGPAASVWEVHWEPNGIPNGGTGELIRRYFDDIFDTARPLEGLSGGDCLVPDTFRHGLILLLHTAHHLINSGVGLRHLCDWAVFAHGVPDGEFAALFEGSLRAAGLWRFAQLLTQLSSRYLGGRACAWAGEADEALLEAMLADVLAGGNFGRKDAERINQAKLFTDDGKRTVDDTGPARQFVHMMNGKARIMFPASKRYPALLPVGWAYAGGRHALRILAGKRPKIHLGRMVSGAAERREIYRQFRLFQPEGQE